MSCWSGDGACCVGGELGDCGGGVLGDAVESGRDGRPVVGGGRCGVGGGVGEQPWCEVVPQLRSLQMVDDDIRDGVQNLVFPALLGLGVEVLPRPPAGR